VILLVAIIAAIVLTHRKRRETKYQDPGQQVRVHPRDRLRVLQMPAEKRES
jgi:NADH-quinone oxidoreductase subunit J